MRIAIYVLIGICALLVAMAYSCCVVAGRAEERAEKAYREYKAWKEGKDGADIQSADE